MFIKLRKTISPLNLRIYVLMNNSNSFSTLSLKNLLIRQVVTLAADPFKLLLVSYHLVIRIKRSYLKFSVFVVGKLVKLLKMIC